MDIVIDFSNIPTQDPWSFILFVLTKIWWIFIPILIWGVFPEFKRLWRDWRKSKYKRRWQYTVLSISAPRLNEQLPNAVENIFTALSGAWKRVDWYEKYFVGKTQVKFSFEIISREGFIEYVVRAPRHYRDLVEAAIYAQYPTVDIAEIPDYTQKYRSLHWPDNDGGYDIWAAELELINKYYYPIRTWKDFGDADIKKYKDPMYGPLEAIAKVKEGEEFWFQITAKPAGTDWQKKSIEHAKKLMGQFKKAPTFINEILSIFSVGADLLKQTVTTPSEAVDSKTKELTSKEKELVGKVEEKAAKQGFESNIRIVYIARKEVFNKNKVKEGFLGALSQFTDLYSNGIVQSKRARVSLSHRYYRTHWRNNTMKNWILQNYCGRKGRDRSEVILNSEELATLWHFPIGDVKSLMLKKSGIVRSEAPFELPTNIREGSEEAVPFGREEVAEEPEVAIVGEADSAITMAPAENEEPEQAGNSAKNDRVEIKPEDSVGSAVNIDDGPPPPDNLPVG